MFNRFKLFIFAIVALCFCGCTLMMDDFDIPEEEKGKDEPYTEVLPIGNVTYKYDEKTTPLNGRAQDYIAMYNDSVVYLMDNIPSEWIPKVGGYVAANTTRKTPLGISGRVTSVTRENGLIRVDHVPATRDEVFDVFKAEFDFSFTVPPIVGYDSLQSEQEGMFLDDTTYVDFNFFERLDSSATTRAVTNIDKEKSETFEFDISHKFNEFYGSLAWLNGTYVGFNLKSTEFKKMHYKEDTEAGFKEEWTDSYSLRKIEGVFGRGTDAKSAKEFVKGKKTSPLGWEEYRQLINLKGSKDYGAKWLELKNKTTAKAPKAKKKWYITTGTAISLVFEFDMDVFFEANGYVDISYTYTTEERRLGYRIEDGNKTPIDDPLKPESEKHYDVFFVGSFDCYLRARVGGGATLGGELGGLGFISGFECKVGIRGEMSLDFPLTNSVVNGNRVIVDREGFRIVPYLSYGGYIKGTASVLTVPFDFFDTNFFTTTKEWPILLGPEIENHKAGYKYVRNDVTGKQDLIINSKYILSSETFNNIGGVPSSVGDRSAGVVIYASDYGRDCVRSYNRIEYDPSFHELKKFEVNLTEAGLPEADQYLVVPMVHDSKHKFYMEFREHAVVLGDSKPKITDTKYTPWYSQEMNEADFEELKKTYPYLKLYKHTDFSEYGFMTQVKLSNTLKMDKWGINYKIYYDNNLSKTIVDKDVYINNGDDKIKAGKYSVIASFFTNFKPANEGDLLGIFICPFYEYYDEGEMKRVDCSSRGPYALPYPYMGDIKISGTTEYVKLN